jgi:methionine-rich copper-binding protein CopC
MKSQYALTALALLALSNAPLLAATVTASATTPVIDGEDLANFGTQTATDKWWPENSATGAAKGQTFRTRNEALRFKAVTYRITTSVPGTKVYTIRIGRISGTSFTPIYTETATQTATWAANNHVTWRLDTPLILQPNTFYGVDVALKSSTTPWQDGIPYISMTADEFSDGVSYTSGTSGVGNATITASDVDRRFHLDIEKPIGGWSLVATHPADNATNVYASNPLLATFSQNIVRGTGNITLKNLTDGVSTVIPITDPRVVISENLLTVNPGSSFIASKAWAVRIDPTAITSVLGDSYPGIANDTMWNFSTGTGDPLYLALVALKNHITGATTLTAAQIAAQKTTIDQQHARLADSAALITASFDLVKAYDASSGNRWYVNGLPARASVTNDIHWTLWNVQQYIMDVTYNDTTLANYESLLNGFKFGSASSFPGACNPPANPADTTRTVTIKASYANTLGWATQGDGSGTFARKPTGCYLAPGSIATVTVPAALVGKGFKIRVGAHSWDFSNKPSIKRLDRSTVLYPINAVETKVACPHGGGIYIEVPWLANQGNVNVSVRNAVRSPYFSAKSFHQTTPTEWLTERTNAAPWADFQSDKFMIQVPRSWIYAMPDPTQMMKDWDAAMDAFNDLLGFPQIRGKESFYLQVDVLTRASVYAPGYPAVNVGGYSATANYNNGYHTHFFIRGPQYGTDDANVEFHEQGHGYFFDKFPGEVESNVNLPFVPVLHRKFGINLDTAFRASLGDGNTYRTLETTAMAWMTVFNFSPNKVAMADGEKAYQLKGHAKFVDIARIYGWGVLGNYWKSFVTDSENGLNYATDTDSLLLRLSKSVGADIRPLFHFWGIYPQNATTLRTAINNAGLVAPVEIYDRLVRYKSLAPANNTAFRDFAYKWWGNKQPSLDGFWEEREHASRWDNYNENSALGITNRVQELIDLYYPNGRPTTITGPVVGSFSPADNSTNVALDANLVLTFNKAIVRGTGNITLTNLTDGTSANIAITNTTQISIAGEVLTINPTANLLANKSYAIQIDPTALDGVVSNSFAGITDTTTWTFTTITPPPAGVTGLALWLDASQLTGLSDGATLNTWNEMSGLGNHATRTTGAPTYETNELNGQPVVRFPVGNGASFGFPRMTNIRTVFWVMKQQNYGELRFLLGDTTNFHFHRGIESPATIWHSVHTSSSIRNGTTSLNGLTVNGTTTPLPSGWNLLSVTTTDVVTASTLSRDRTFDRSWEGDIAEVLVYNRALSAVESEQVGGYLTAKYAMTTSYGPPVISTYSPADNATGVAVGADLVATFSEPIAKGTGNIMIRNLTDGTATNIAVADAQVTVSGATLTINPTANLLAGKNYAIQIAATAVKDLAGSNFAGITNDTAWNFGTEAPPPVFIMFADNFDRPNSTDLNASTVGKSGSLGALNWVEKVGSGGNASISGNSLFATGATSGFSMSYVDHNFIDAAISSGGGFSISIDLEHYSTQGTIRLLGIAMGMSKAEAEGWAHNVPTSFTYADLFVGYRGNQSAIQVFDNGTEVINNTTAGDASTLPKKLQIDFTCPDFNAGSTVNYAVTFGGAAMGTGSFTWSGTNENYIGVYSNLFPASGTTGQMDDFAVAALIAEPPPSPYETWAATNAPGSEPDEDIDGDGVPNAIEFVLGGDKNTKDLGKLPIVATTGTNMTFTFVRDRDSVDPSVSVVIEVGPNLGTWPNVFTVGGNTADSSAGVTVTDNGNGTDTITLTVPQAPDTKKFARLKVAITE